MGSSFRLVGTFENRFGGLTVLPVVQVLGHMSHEQLALLERADRIPEGVVHLLRDVVSRLSIEYAWPV